MSTENTNETIVPEPITTEPVQPAPELVDRKAFDSVKADMHKYKAENQKLQKDLDDAKIAKLKDSKNWEEIASLKSQEADTFKAQYEGLKGSLVDREKNSALEREALKAGIHPQSLGDLYLLDFDELHVETTSTGKIIVNGADKAISSLKLKRPHWFSTKPVTINSTTPEVLTPTGALTLADLESFEAQYKKNPHDQIAKAKYFDAIQKFKSQ